LATNTPATTVPTPETGSIGAPSPHKTVVFNKPAAVLAKKAAEAEKRMEKADAAEVEASVASASTVEAAA